MEKISLRPEFREILHKGQEQDVLFDVLSYSGTTAQEKHLGSITVLGYLRQKDDDLSYLVSLVSSLAKREFYSAQSISEQDPRAAFERTLKKLNEVLEDYFKNKDFTLNLGIAAISGDNIYISRLGKFKVALARNNEYIDILNNVSLFSKQDGNEQQFANIISGKLKPDDKIFAYFPLRTVTTREKVLNPLFISQQQDDFCNKIDSISQNAINFTCCGVHILMRQIKEIPIEPDLPEVQSPKQKTETEPVKLAVSSPKSPKVTTGKTIDQTEKEIDKAPANVIRAELSVAKRANIFKVVGSKIFSLPIFNKKRNLGIVRQNRGNGGFRWIGIALFALVVGSGGWWLLGRSGNSQNAALYSQVSESLKLAKSRLGQNETREARDILRSALAQIGTISDKNIDSARIDISKTLNIIDQVSDKKPEKYASAVDFDPGFILLTSVESSIFAVGGDGKLYSVTSEKIQELGKFNFIPKFIESNASNISAYDGQGTVAVYDTKKNSFADHTLKDATESRDAKFYQNNLYTLSGTDINKYTDAVIGNSKKTAWGSDGTDGDLISIAVDGNIYVLSSNGKIIKFFKGKKESEFTLSVQPSSQSEILTGMDWTFIYMTDIANDRIYVFDKASGSLKNSYDLSDIEQVKDIFVSPDGTVWIISNVSVWTIRP